MNAIVESRDSHQVSARFGYTPRLRVLDLKDGRYYGLAFRYYQAEMATYAHLLGLLVEGDTFSSHWEWVREPPNTKLYFKIGQIYLIKNVDLERRFKCM